MTGQFKPGDLVIYRKPKHFTHSGPRAEDVHPAAHGEDCFYRVDKFWAVVAVQSDGKTIVRTRRGKEHVLAPDDPLLKKARWWERLLWKGRFPRVNEPFVTE